MASNYRTSAGTDLDSVFYINNSNAGAIGFKVAEGQDLGNRYVSGSLGYNVGLKNSAGTDLGYLRGGMIAPTGSAAVTATNSKVVLTDCYGWDPNLGNEGGNTWFDMYLRTVSLNVSIAPSNSMPISNVDVYLEEYNNYGGSHPMDLRFYTNLTSEIPKATATCGDSCFDDISISGYTNCISNRIFIPGKTWGSIGLVGSIPSTNFQMTVSYFMPEDPSNYNACDSTLITHNGEQIYGYDPGRWGPLRLSLYISNAVGGSWITTEQFAR